MLVNHKSKDSHHGGTAVVELDSTLLQLYLIRESVPSGVKFVVAEISREFASDDILHDEQFEESDEGNDLVNSGSGDTVGANGSPSVGEGVEGGSGLVDGSRKVESGTGDNVSEEGKHTDTSVLDLNISKTIESGLVSVGDQSERIVKTKWRLGTEGIFESSQRSAGSLLLSRSESGGRGDKGGEDGGLHGYIFELVEFVGV